MEILTATIPDESLSLKQVQARLRIGPTKAYQLVASHRVQEVKLHQSILKFHAWDAAKVK